MSMPSIGSKTRALQPAAATVVTVLAISMLVAGAGADVVSRADARPVASESRTVRAVAAAVAAVARDLLSIDHTATLAARPPLADLIRDSHESEPACRAGADASPPELPREQLLDLPPPTC